MRLFGDCTKSCETTHIYTAIDNNRAAFWSSAVRSPAFSEFCVCRVSASTTEKTVRLPRALAKSIDLLPGKPVTVVVDSYLKPGEFPYLTFDDSAPGSQAIFTVGAKDYTGPGLAILSQSVEGPIFESWPPPSTQKLLGKLDLWRLRGATGRHAG